MYSVDGWRGDSGDDDFKVDADDITDAVEASLWFS